MIEIRHLRLVRAIAEEGGVTRAAARLHLTQSAVSHQLTELEGRLGIALFNRVRRRLVLTSAGRRVLALSETVLEQIALTEGELLRREQAPLCIRLCTETFTSYQWLPPVIERFQRDGEEVDVQIVLEATRDPIAYLVRGDIDLALVSSPVKDHTLRVHPLFEDEWVVVLPPGHPLGSKRFLSAVDLEHQTLITHIAPARDVERLRDWVAAERARMPRVQVVSLTEVIVAMVQARLGVALMSSWAVGPYVDEGRVMVKRFTEQGLREQWSLVHRAEMANQIPCTRFMEIVHSLWKRT